MDNTATLIKPPTHSNTSTNCNQKNAEPAISEATYQNRRETSSPVNRNGHNHSNNENNSSTVDSSIDQESPPGSDQKNDSSSLSMAFTVSLEDDPALPSKKFGIRDSIRRFAPPKPNTIEKPRPPRSDNTDYSLESLPANLSKHSSGFSRHSNNSYRSSCRRSNASNQSNVSESAAFLINRMLNCNQQPDVEPRSRSSHHQSNDQSRLNNQIQSSNDIIDREVDFCEDKSDNGTYIVGTDPESEAARKKIDELFGVLKAAEASVIANSSAKGRQTRESGRDHVRESRLPERKPLSRERQERIDRLAKNSSRSSSSSRNEPSKAVTQSRRSSSRNSHTSCDRTTKAHTNSRPRRSASQSSRRSSNKEHSDQDTRSSRSSLRNEEAEANSQDGTNLSSPISNMKYNRAFALRRARLGLGEPPSYRLPVQENEHISIATSRNQRRDQCYDYKPGSSSTFSRADGGRFSLRSKGNITQTRYASSASRLLSSQNPGVDSYMSRIPSSRVMGISSGLPTSQPDSPIRSITKTVQQTSPQSNRTYLSGDELESPSRYRFQYRSSRLPMVRGAGYQAVTGILSDFEVNEVDRSSDKQRINYSSIGTDHDINYYNMGEGRAGSSIGKRGSSHHLSALDSLVISAISTLSLKIRSTVCELLLENAKKLPTDNETRLIVEEILPQLTDHSSSNKSPTSIEEIDQSLCFDLAKTLKNLKKIEQMVEVISLISNQLPNQSSPISSSITNLGNNSNLTSNITQTASTGVISTTADSNTSTNSNVDSPLNDLSPV